MFRLVIWIDLLLASSLARAGIEGCADGNTCFLESPQFTGDIRIFCIQAPEMQEPLGMQARDALRREVHGTIRVLIDGLDQDGRPVAELVREDGMNLGLELVRAGLAKVASRHCDEPLYPLAEMEARDAKIGLWASGERGESMPPQRQPREER